MQGMSNTVEESVMEKTKRPSWDEYFMEMASCTAKRSTCMRRNVGAVIVKDKRAIATGYNGAPKGIRHCEDRGGCLRQKLGVPSGQRHELCMALHAEQNAIIQAASMGHAIEGGTIYITHQPSGICAKMIVNGRMQTHRGTRGLSGRFGA